jgi:hypothetical protein
VTGLVVDCVYEYCAPIETVVDTEVVSEGVDAALHVA